jgi:hypothetical protein
LEKTNGSGKSQVNKIAGLLIMPLIEVRFIAFQTKKEGSI